MARPKQLHPNVVRKIRQVYALGEETQAEIAERFQISQSTVCKIINNCIHKQLDHLEICGSAEVKVGLKYGNQK
jgi:DNA-binding transcriptional regulator LsrR (DeoR family)